MRGVPPELRAAYRLLRGAGFAPEEVTVRRELAEIERRIAACEEGADAERADLVELRGRRAALELRRNFAAERRLR